MGSEPIGGAPGAADATARLAKEFQRMARAGADGAVPATTPVPEPGGPDEPGARATVSREALIAARVREEGEAVRERYARAFDQFAALDGDDELSKAEFFELMAAEAARLDGAVVVDGRAIEREEAQALRGRGALASGEVDPGHGPTHVAVALVRDAQKWLATAPASHISGAKANEVVTDTYHELDFSFQRYMGGPGAAHRRPPMPAVTNWMSFGKYASREAGSQLARIENGLGVLDRYDPKSGLRGLHDALGHFEELGGPGMAMFKSEVLDRVAKEGIQHAPRIVGEFRETLRTFRDALVIGNTEIFARAAVSYKAFLDAEARGEDGLAALKAAGFGGGPLDPQNFVYDGFAKYKAAHALEPKIEALPDGPERDALIARRTELAAQGTLLMGFQEQLLVLQTREVFGHPTVHRLMGAMTGQLRLHDANGVHELLPTPGRNWASFVDRMGIREITAEEARTRPDAVRATFPSDGGVGADGVTRWYVPSDDPAVLKGTIAEAFGRGAEGPIARKLMEGRPRELPPELGPKGANKLRDDVWRGFESAVEQATRRLPLPRPTR